MNKENIKKGGCEHNSCVRYFNCVLKQCPQYCTIYRSLDGDRKEGTSFISKAIYEIKSGSDSYFSEFERIFGVGRVRV